MTPLEVRVAAGLEDCNLEKHITALEGFARRSDVENRTLALLYKRLDQLTDPKLSAETVKADPRLGLVR